MVPTNVLQALQTQPLKESSTDPSVAGLIAVIHAMHDLLMQYRCVVPQHCMHPCKLALLADETCMPCAVQSVGCRETATLLALTI